MKTLFKIMMLALIFVGEEGYTQPSDDQDSKELRASQPPSKPYWKQRRLNV